MLDSKCAYVGTIGTALLRKLMQHTSPEGGMSRRISELWVLLNYYDGTSKWTACTGVYCAKILARLGDKVKTGDAWSLMNGILASLPSRDT